MSYTSLADFLEELDRLGQLRSIDEASIALGQSAGIVQAMAKACGTALLIRNIRGSRLPLATGLLATPERIACALGVRSIDEISKRLEQTLAAKGIVGASPVTHEQNQDVRGTLEDLWYDALARFTPRVVKTGACQKVVRLGRDVDLEQLPFPDGRPEETHRLITAGQLISRDTASDGLRIGHVELSVRSSSELAVHWTFKDPMARLFEMYRERGESMPLAVVLGGHPANLLAAMAPLPIPVDRGTLAGLLAGKALDVVRCRTVDLKVPAEAEMVIEGAIDPTLDNVETGPVATPLGHYARSRPVPVMRVSALTYRANPVLPTIVHGPESCEWIAIQRAMQRIMLPLLKVIIPGLVDVNLPECGHGRELAWVAVHKSHTATVRHVAQALWKWPAARFCKLTIIVDEDVDVHDPQDVWTSVAENMDPRKDVFFDDGPADPWDKTDDMSPCRRMALDATARLTNDE